MGGHGCGVHCWSVRCCYDDGGSGCCCLIVVYVVSATVVVVVVVVEVGVAVHGPLVLSSAV